MKRDFFSKPEVKTAIRNYCLVLKNQPTGNSFEKNRNDKTIVLLESFTHRTEELEEKTQVNINYISERFLSDLKEADTSREGIDNIFSSAFRFLIELNLNSKGELGRDYLSIKSFAIHQLNLFSDDARIQIEYALREMPISIMKELLHGEDFTALKAFPSVSLKAEEIMQKIESELTTKEERIKELSNILDNYQSAFNFVGLHKGFDDLSSKKKEEKKRTFYLLISLAFLVLTPISLELIFLYFKAATFPTALLSISLVPMVSLTFILIYYFRISLINYQSVSSQINQIELRKTLCQFIQDYTKYSTEIKKSNKEALDKFELIIFSNIMSSDEKIPSSYDGLEQVANIIKGVKGQ
ncbi:hypothetical protein [Chimaeribacter arupi]|uniref:Uncharacterized protein n=1 Tax=Chimaeribacter arupi TaxID=2060066 RepID=A0A2N5EJ63_9GAMM|nr:hypothetical protein [Chimaeribacter arupi]PLR45425.1 hypothetical protein CYR34_17635 [Chimaeribacter arupi]